MKLRINKAKRNIFIALCGFVFLGLGAPPAEAINYNDQGTTNYLGWATNDFRLKVGVDEADNTLFVTNGGIAEMTEVYVGELSSSTGNLLSITNGGLVLAGHADTNNLSTGGIVVGDTDGKGLLSVNHSSEVDTDYLYLGIGTNESGTVRVEEKSLLTVREQLIVGSAANSNNVMDVKTGGAVFINETSDLVINNISGATNSFNTVNIESTGKLLVAGDVNATSFIATSNLNLKAGAILGVGGQLTIDDSTIEDSLNILLDNGLGTNTATWNTGEMYLGDTTGHNSLTLTNGATAKASDIIYVGNKASSSGNSVNVSGTNSVLTALDKVFIGAAGDNNKLKITEGGSVAIAKDLKLGASLGSDNNSVTISGEGSALSVSNDLIIGDDGKANTFTISAGQVDVSNDLILGSGSINNRYSQTGGTNTVAGEFIIGETEDATGKTGHVDDDRVETTGNLAIVGEGATLDLQTLTVGLEGGGSIMTIRDGGSVNVAEDVIIGEAVGDNYIYLQRDADTRFNVEGDLIVGKEGGSNRFAVYGGTATIDGDLYLGSTTNQHEVKNFIHLETTNAVLNVANALHIGASNSVNTIDLVDGATVNAQDLFVGTFEGVSNNVATVTGDDSLLSVSNSLSIGSNSGSNNVVNVDNGGTLFVGGDINIGASTNDLNNRLNINDGGTLQTLDWDFATISSNILLNSGSSLELSGTLSGTNQIEGGIGFVLNGTNALWDTGTNMLYVGNETSNNSLSITNGATASTATNLYIGFASANNTVTVGGSNSVLYVGNDLHIGNMEQADDLDFADNSLTITDGASVTVSENAYLSKRGKLRIDSKSAMYVGGDYEQDQYSTLEVGVSSNQVQPNLVVAGEAAFSKSTDTNTYSIIKVFDEGISESNVIKIVQADTITLDGIDATGGSLAGSIASNALLGFTISTTNDTIYSYIVLDDFIKYTWADAADLDGMLANVANEIENMTNEFAQAMDATFSDGRSGQEINKAMNDYYGKKGSSVPTHNVINQGIGGVASELTVRGDNTRERTPAAQAPTGAAGPHTQEQELQGWVAGYGSWGSHDASDGYHGYDADLSGFIIGADLAVSQNILVGLAGGSNSGSVDKDNGGSGDSKTTFGAVYASVGTQDWFFDGSIIYGGSEIDQTLGEVFDTTASYDAQNLAFYFGGGKEITGSYLIITPQASLMVNYYEQDAYDEESNNAVGRSVDSFDALYVQSSLGCSLGFYTAMGNTTLKPELRAHWLHEFNASEESLPYRLIGGNGTPYAMSLQAPEEDIIRLGAGIAAKMSDYLELRVDLDTQQASSYSDFTLLGSLRYQF